MNQKSFAIIILAILMAQPLVIVSSMGLNTHSLGLKPSTMLEIAQDAGTRLEPNEHSTHVPIIIDGHDDFVTQGWPGAGSEGDPWVISGYNITYNVGLPNVQILNVDDYFVIRDCYLNQITGFDDCIHLENTSHATIEYLTMTTNGHGVTLDNANNTLVSHLDITAGLGSGIDADDSYYCHFDSNIIAQGYRGVDVGSCLNVTITSNEIHDVDDDGIYVDSSNYSYIASNFVHHIGGSGIATSLAWYAEILSNLVNATVGDGMFIASEYALIQDNTVTRAGDNAIHFSTYDWISIIDNALNDTYSYPINAVATGVSNGEIVGNIIAHTIGSYSACIALQGGNHQNFTITDNFFIDQWGGLFTMPSGRWIDFSRNHAFDMGQYLVAFQSFDDCNVINNTLETSNTWGVYSTTSHRLNIVGNTINDVATTAIYIGGVNATIMNNTCNGGNIGIDIQTISHRAVVQYNTFESYSMGIDINADDCIVDNNEVRDTSTGIDIHTNSDRTEVTNNVIGEVDANAINVRGINSTISNNAISGVAEIGINLSLATSPVVTNNVIVSDKEGIFVSASTKGVFINNNMTNSGFRFATGQVVVYQNHTFSGNYVNDKPLYYALNLSGLSLDGYNWGEIILVNCSYSVIHNGMFQWSSSAIEILHSKEIDVSSVQIIDQLYGVDIYNSVNVSVVNSIFTGRADGAALRAYTVEGLSVENSNFTNLVGVGVDIEDVSELTVGHCRFLDIATFGIDVDTGTYGLIEHNEFINMTSGIRLGNTQFFLITNSQFKWNMHGIYAFGESDNNNVTYCDIHDNTYGIKMDDSYSWFIYNNTIAWNDYGLYITTTDNNQVIYNNTFLLNAIYNGFDDGNDDWDDHVDGGNYWHDYSGSGVYNIPGGTSVDNYPISYIVYEPIINSPQDLWYPEGSIGNFIVWYPFDNSLKDWSVQIDGSVWTSGIWNFENVNVSIDGLAYGTHMVSVTVRDVDMNTVQDTVIIHVYDDTPPEIDSPANQWLFVDATEQTIDWEVSDLNPDTYVLTVDGEEFDTGTWDSGILSLDVDEIEEGEHTLVLTIYDVDGNSASGTILIRVIDDNANPTIEDPEDIIYTEGTTGNSIVWDAEDEYPATFEIRFNNTVIYTGSWGGARIVVNVDGLAPGMYEYELRVYDMSDNMATSSVNVTVIPIVPIEPPLIIDWLLAIIIGAVIGGVIVVVGIIYYMRKRATSS